MKALFDIRCLGQPTTGIQVVAENLLAELASWADGFELALLASEVSRERLRDFPGEVLWSEIGPYDFRRQKPVAQQINASGCDLFLSPTYFIPYGVKKPYIMMVHDLIPRKVWLGRSSLYVRLFLGGRIRRALAVWTVSEYSRREILALYSRMDGSVHVVPSGFSSERSASSGMAEPRSLLLFASRFRHKNVEFALRVFRLLQESSGNVWRLHVIGNAAHLPGVSGLPGIELHGRVSDEALNQVYGRTWGVLLPSIEEGFSLPLLEGMAHGGLVFYHRDTAMREIAGDGAIGLDLSSPERWAREILRFSGDRPLAEEQRAAAKRRATHFSRDRFSRAVRVSWRDSLERLPDEADCTHPIALPSA